MRHPLQRTGTWLMVLLLLLPAASLSARERTGTICGIVVDEMGRGLARASVFLIDGSGSTLLESTLTDSDGRYRFDGLFPAAYRLRAEHPGFLPSGLGPLTAETGRMATAPFVLRPGSPAPDPLVAAARAVEGRGEAPPAVADAGPPESVVESGPEGTVAETLAGVNRDALKAIDRPVDPSAGDQAHRGDGGLSGDVMVAAQDSGAEGDQSILMASLEGLTLGPTHWTVELSRENTPSLFSSGLGGPLLWRVVRTESAAFELRTIPVARSGARLPEQTFRLELAEQMTGESHRSTATLRTVSAEWNRAGAGRHGRMGLDLYYGSGGDWPAGVGPRVAEGQPGRSELLLLGGRYSGEIAGDHELQLRWRHGSLAGDPAGIPFHASSGPMPGAPGGFVGPLSEGWETVINGSDRWRATDPLHLLCNMEYRIAGGERSTRLARPSMGLVYVPFERMSLTSSVGLAMRSTRVGHSAGMAAGTVKSGDGHRTHRHSEVEYGLSLEQVFGEGYNLEVDLSVEDVQPVSVVDFDPAASFGPAAGGMLLLADGGTARKREMRLSLAKDFGPLLAGRLGTSILHGTGDIVALAAVPGSGHHWPGPDGGSRVRGITGHVDTYLPGLGTGILVTFHRLTNLDPGLIEQNHAPVGEITGLDLGLRQHLLRTAGLDLQLLMAISSLSTGTNSFQGLMDSLVGEHSPYRRIVGGLRVHF